MRIGVLIDTFPMISQSFVINQVVGLMNKGHEVRILARRGGGGGRVHGEVIDFDLLDHTLYAPCPEKRLRRIAVAVSGLIQVFRRSPESAGRLLRSLDPLRFGKSALNLRLFFDVLPLLPSEEYDVLYCHFGPNGLRAVSLREIGVLKGPIVTVFHGYDVSRYPLQHGSDVYTYLFRSGELFLSVNNNWRDRLIELGCPSEKLAVHHMGIDTRRFRFRRRSFPDKEAVRLLSVARLVEKKGIEVALEALALLKERNSLGHLLYEIVGEGPLRAHLEERVERLGLQAEVRFLGALPGEDVRKILDMGHILLAPSVTAADGDQEGIPVAIMEAMAMGMPVVSTYHGGIPELVEDGVSGYLVPERDPRALSAAIARLLAYPERWPTMGEAGRQVVERDYNQERLNDRLIHLLTQAAYGRS